MADRTRPHSSIRLIGWLTYRGRFQNAPEATTDMLADNGWRAELGSHAGAYPFKLTRDMLDVSRRYYKKYLANQGALSLPWR
jgi:hypothetical protein